MLSEGTARMAQTWGAPPRPSYRVPVGEAQSELVVKRSVFIGTLGPAPSSEAARAFVNCIRSRYPDADHHAWAFQITAGPQGEIGSSDDGEPGGTAGRPMLAVLAGNGLHQVVAVGTRYFGGTKLGTGGLVRAYSGAAREALAYLPTQEYVVHHVARMRVEYHLYGSVQYLLSRYQVRIEERHFADDVMLALAVPYDHAAELSRLLSEMTNGRIVLSAGWIGDRYDVRAP